MSAEIELKLHVPAASRPAVVAALRRVPHAVVRTSLAADYLDTAERHLAKAGLSWRVRREGRQWVQTLKAAGRGMLERAEHSAPRPQREADPQAHAGTPAGEQLLALLAAAREAGHEPQVRFRSEVRRMSRRVRTRGALVEVAFDVGTLVAGDRTQPVSELEFELLSGSARAMLALARRWRRDMGLTLEHRSKAERGDALAQQAASPVVRKARAPDYASGADASDAFGPVLDECLAQVLANTTGLLRGDAQSRVEHVHQARVGIRRLRSALRTFTGWVAEPPARLVDGLRRLFAELGRVRDSDVLAGGVMASLMAAGAPAPRLPESAAAPDAHDVVASDDAQDLLMDWLIWRASLDDAAVSGPLPSDPAAAAAGKPLAALAARRLARWHQRIASQVGDLADLDDAALHALRRRVKRQRYAVELLSPLLRRRGVARYLKALAPAQECLGELTDLFVARDLYQSTRDTQPATWFALGWLAARISTTKAAIEPALRALADAAPPTARRRGKGHKRAGRLSLSGA